MQVSDAVKNQALDALAKLGGRMYREADVLWQGNKLIIPEGMSFSMLRKFIDLREKEDEAAVAFSRTFPYRPWDGGVALDKALEKAFGTVVHLKQPGVFGPTPPAMITIPTGVDSTVQVPWGPLAVPLLPGMEITPFASNDPEQGQIFGIAAEGPRKYRDHVEGIFTLVEEELAASSIYRGKAFDGKQMPDFLDTDAVDPKKIIFPEETLRQLEASVFAPIEYPEELKALDISGKRAVLLHGPFGTGKTSTAMLVAKKCQEAGRTFVYAVPGRDNLEEVFKTARIYQPSAVFCEDLDNVADMGDGESISSLLDLFDGFQAKGTDILAILTTNYPEKIHKGMIRPGRLDALIHLGPPDAQGVEKLIKLNVPVELLAKSIDWAAVANSMGGEDENGVMHHYLPAFVAEASQRALRYAIVRNKGEKITEITEEDLVNAGVGLRPQWEMMQDAPESTPADTLGVTTRKLAREAAVEALIERGM